jgi:hypothetical protein
MHLSSRDHLSWSGRVGSHVCFFWGRMTGIQKRNRRLVDILLCRGSSRQPRSFSFGKRTQNHGGRGVALRVPCVVCRLRRRTNSLRSNNARLPPNSAARLGLATMPRDSNYGLIFRDESPQHHNFDRYHDKKTRPTHLPKVPRLPPGPGSDAQIIRRALSERRELARPPKTRVRPI